MIIVVRYAVARFVASTLIAREHATLLLSCVWPAAARECNMLLHKSFFSLACIQGLHSVGLVHGV
jgi:hypothetical protein